ncbi:MAG TPA: S8 family serine peptidase [Gemmataceae bacterium]|nr:S8 family serine peptidase [Gemmataceae bacterium]
MSRHRRARLALHHLEDRTAPSATAPDYASDSILVRLKPAAPQVLAAVAAGVNLDHQLGLVNGLWEARLAPGKSVSAALKAARANPFVQYAEPNYLLHAATTPNDPKYTDGTLWGMNKIAMPAAWDVSTGGSTLVAVIDTGVDYNHPDLQANIWSNALEAGGQAGVDDDGNGFVDDVHGWDFANNDSNPLDDHSHGTHVAGTIAGVGNNGVGVVGVNWSARIMALKFLDASGNGTTAAAISALNYAVMMGARVSNHSYGGGPFDQANLDALTAAGNAGHLVVAAAGNGNFFGFPINNDTTPFYPASYKPNPDNVISVAATDSTDKFASFSNYGATSVDLAAPGVNIYSTVPGGYGTKSGTSMAAPHVTGAAALIWAADPSLTMTQVRQRILSGTDSIQALNPNRPTVTNGRLNVFKAMPQAPRLSVSDATVTEGDTGTTTATFTVTLSPGSTQTVTVDFATADGSATVADSDYVTAGDTLTFTPGETTKTVFVTVVGDTAIEPTETFTLNLSNSGSTPIQDGQGVGTIVNDDGPGTFQFSSATYSTAEGTTVTVTVTRTGGSSGTVTVDYATSNGTAGGDDYTTANGSLTFDPGVTAQTFTVTTTADDMDEANETVNLTLSNPTGGAALGSPATAVLTIQDDDPPPAITITDAQATEGNSGTKAFTFTVTLSAPSGLTVTVNFATANGTATTGNKDYFATSGTLTFNPGETTKTITVQVRGDTKREANETFFVNLSAATNATILDGQGLGTILNDD